eukprot:6386462-Ditylum_brightwellii.AAC.1
MTDICCFNIGGHKYQVSRSLLKQHPNTMLARISSEVWQKDPEAEIFVDQNGDQGVDEGSIDDGPVERLYWGRAITKSNKILAKMEMERECLEVAAILFHLYRESKSEK